MLKKPDQMLGDSPLPPRDRFMVWVKTIKNTLVFSLVSLWVSASCNTKWNHTEPGSLGLHHPREVEYHMTKKYRTETRGRHKSRRLCFFPVLSLFLLKKNIHITRDMCVTNGKITTWVFVQRKLTYSGCKSMCKVVTLISKGVASLVQNLGKNKSIVNKTYKDPKHTVGSL